MRHHRVVCPYCPWTITGKAWLLDPKNIPSSTSLFLLKVHYDTIEYFDKRRGITQKATLAKMDRPGTSFFWFRVVVRFWSLHTYTTENCPTVLPSYGVIVEMV